MSHIVYASPHGRLVKRRRRVPTPRVDLVQEEGNLRRGTSNSLMPYLRLLVWVAATFLTVGLTLRLLQETNTSSRRSQQECQEMAMVNNILEKYQLGGLPDYHQDCFSFQERLLTALQPIKERATTAWVVVSNRLYRALVRIQRGAAILSWYTWREIRCIGRGLRNALYDLTVRPVLFIKHVVNKGVTYCKMHDTLFTRLWSLKEGQQNTTQEDLDSIANVTILSVENSSVSSEMPFTEYSTEDIIAEEENDEPLQDEDHETPNDITAKDHETPNDITAKDHETPNDITAKDNYIKLSKEELEPLLFNLGKALDASLDDDAVTTFVQSVLNTQPQLMLNNSEQ